MCFRRESILLKRRIYRNLTLKLSSFAPFILMTLLYYEGPG